MPIGCSSQCVVNQFIAFLESDFYYCCTQECHVRWLLYDTHGLRMMGDEKPDISFSASSALSLCRLRWCQSLFFIISTAVT